MTTSMPPHDARSFPRSAPAIEQVSDDMATIFGPNDGRGTDRPPAASGRAASRSRGTMLVLGGVGLLAAVTVGVFAGRTAVEASAPAETAAPAARHLFSPPTAPPAAIAATPPLSPVAVPVGEAATRTAVTRVRTPGSNGADVQGQMPPAAVDPVPPAAIAAAPTGAPSVGDERPVAATDCDLDSNDCIDARLDVADRRVARALDRAASAGVRPRDLRGYASEWNRARRDAEARPIEALHVYGMIESDLYTLADRASARAAGDLR